MLFKDRFDAAEKLAEKLSHYKNNPDVIIVAIPRGGLELGYVLARKLHAPLDVIFTKKIGFPGHPEYAIGAASLDSYIVDEQFKNDPYVQQYIDAELIKIRDLLKKRYIAYTNGTPSLDLANKIVILTDDGIATGKTVAITVELLKTNKPKKIIVAVPVAAQEAAAYVKTVADELVCLEIPETFYGVSQFYQRFDQVSDEEAIRLLHEASK